MLPLLRQKRSIITLVWYSEIVKDKFAKFVTSLHDLQNGTAINVSKKKKKGSQSEYTRDKIYMCTWYYASDMIQWIFVDAKFLLMSRNISFLHEPRLFNEKVLPLLWQWMLKKKNAAVLQTLRLRKLLLWYLKSWHWVLDLLDREIVLQVILEVYKDGDFKL